MIVIPRQQYFMKCLNNYSIVLRLFPFDTLQPKYFINQALHFLHIAQCNRNHKTRFDTSRIFLPNC